MVRIARTLGALVCAMAVGISAVSLAPDSHTRGDSTSEATVAVSRTVAANESAAQADAASLLSEVSLPPGSAQSSLEPPEDDSVLAHPASGPPATPNVVDDSAWWLVPGTPAAVLAYIKAHPPAGSIRASVGSASSGTNGSSYQFETIEWPAITDVLSMRWLIVTVVQLPDGSTGLRMDAQVVWVTPRPASERIPSGTHTLLVSVGGVIPANNPKQRPLTVSSSKKINGIVGLLNVLPAAQPGVFSCPVDFGVRVRLAFYARRGVAPLAIAIVDPDGCGGVSLTIGGQPQPPLGSKAHPGSSTPSRTSLVQQIDHLLGVKLKIGPA